ncbi:MAG: cupin domain-containing protein [Eubacteriales bacterium]|nr:cupin domain-containing protein [Eubacteriales bacterium]
MNINEKMKEMRLAKGYTLEMLAGATGFTKGYLSKIERSNVPPPFATVQKITEALQFDMVDLFKNKSETADSKNIDIVKHTGKEEDPDSVYSFIPLVNSYRNKQMLPFLFTVKKGETQQTTHDSEEFVYVTQGSVELNYEGRTYMLERGDAFYLDARITHYFVNRQETSTLLIAVHFNYRRF